MRSLTPPHLANSRHSHLYSFALRFLCLQTHATSYSFYSSVTEHCKGERRKSWQKTIPSSLWFKKSIQKPQVWELSSLCPRNLNEIVRSWIRPPYSMSQTFFKGVGVHASGWRGTVGPDGDCLPQGHQVCLSQLRGFRHNSKVGSGCSLNHALQRNLDLCIPRKGIARPQFQFPHSCVCERSICFHVRAHLFSCSKICRPIRGIFKSLTKTWMYELEL
jgi:hypothetical protein